MPTWFQWIIGAGALLGACSVIYSKLIRPLDRLILYAHDVIPLLITITDRFKDNPELFDVVKEIAAQFKSDSGSTLRDIVNGLQESARISAEAARVNAEAASVLRIKAQVLEESVAAVKELSRVDRAESAHRLALLEELIARKG